jgi:cob(I)alamin adenosyltransferase
MVKLNKIYTRTGDAGSTGLVDGSRVSKAGARMAAIGDVDEANSALGVALTLIDPGALRDGLLMVQNEMFDLGADLATPWQPDAPGEYDLRVTDAQVDRVEAMIDAVNADLTPLTSFILPGGTPAAAAMHVVRAVARRAERSVVAANAEHPLNPVALRYINRLSDLFFVVARALNQSGGGDVLWVPGASR